MDDTEVAVEDACVLSTDSLKRECSQLSVSFGTLLGQLLAGFDVRRRVLIVERMAGLGSRTRCGACP